MCENPIHILVQDIKDSLKHWNMHQVCFYCRNPKKCKTIHTYWSGQMPPNIFCDKYME